ncbi:MAG: nitrogenase component 1 [Spirochaetales bacterium]|nr:nitrogenase component 1 [Spirochaetales bacterium]
MNNLLKRLSPFAPDLSGAVSVLYELGGLTVICDAGGCTGNICGFDEPRWFHKKSAIFSAGLRDIDAILGRDDKLIEKLQDAASKTNVDFTTLVGTPVPAVIATDFKALKRMAEKRTGLPSITIETTGTRYYDEGAEQAYLELFKTFSVEQLPVKKGSAGVIGATPLDFSNLEAEKNITVYLENRGWKNTTCYGMGSGLEFIKKASAVEKNIVVSPSGLKAAEYLKEKFGTPYITNIIPIPESLQKELYELKGKKILIIHQQVAANSVRDLILKKTEADITVASWFMLKESLMQEHDFRLTEEDQLKGILESGDYDVVIGDEIFRRVMKKYNGRFIDFPHFAVSGRLEK